jgi:hypothetical protein
MYLYLATTPNGSSLPGRSLVAAEKELEVLGRQRLHGGVIRVDRRVDHVRLFLLEEDHAALHRVLDAETGDDAGTRLADSVASICRLPLGGWVPPSKQNESVLLFIHSNGLKNERTDQ